MVMNISRISTKNYSKKKKDFQNRIITMRIIICVLIHHCARSFEFFV